MHLVWECRWLGRVVALQGRQGHQDACELDGLVEARGAFNREAWHGSGYQNDASTTDLIDLSCFCAAHRLLERG